MEMRSDAISHCKFIQVVKHHLTVCLISIKEVVSVMTTGGDSSKLFPKSIWVCIPTQGRAVPAVPQCHPQPDQLANVNMDVTWLRASMPGRIRSTLPLITHENRTLLTFSPFLTGCADKPHPIRALTISNHNVSSQFFENSTILCHFRSDHCWYIST